MTPSPVSLDDVIRLVAEQIAHTEKVLTTDDSRQFPTNAELQQELQAEKIILTALQNEKDRRWVPVSERLPEVRKTVIIWMLYHDDEAWRGYYDGSKWWGDNLGWDGDSDVVEVTHWMPLPTAPTPPAGGAK